MKGKSFHLVRYLPFFLVLILILLCLSVYLYFSREPFVSIPEDFGFIITRHVNSEETNNVWKVCLKEIRKNYPTEKVVIIDDNSNYDFVTESDVNLNNCEVINSEFKKRGELLAYYYYYKHQWFEKAVYIHDSVFLHKPLPIQQVKNVKFLWYFNPGEYDNTETIKRILDQFGNDEVKKCFEEKRYKGCWGVMSVIEHRFLKYIFEKYNMFTLLDFVQNRDDRIAIERIFGIICVLEEPSLMDHPSILGHFGQNKNNRNSFDYSFKDYLDDVQNNRVNSTADKLFFSR